MKLVTCLLIILASSTQSPPKQGKVESVHDAKANFAQLATYTWEKGREAFDPAAHRAIVEAVDAEMSALGFRLLPAGTGDVTVRYHTVTRTDVVLDKLDELQGQSKGSSTQAIGRLVVEMRDKANRRIWAADSVQPLAPVMTQVYKEIPSYVTRLFATYPGRKK